MDFFGSDFDKKSLAVRSFRIHALHRAGESDLLKLRWFDQTRMCPVTATYLYAHHYKLQTAVFYETVIDIESVEDARAFSPDDIFSSRDMTAMWLARRCADSHSLPYDFVLRFAQRRALSRYAMRFPRPNQLYSEEFELDVLDEWNATLARSLRYSRQPQYLAENWKGHQDQVRHVIFVADQIRKRAPESHIGLLARMFHEKILSPANLPQGAFSSHTVAAALEQCRDLVQ